MGIIKIHLNNGIAITETFEDIKDLKTALPKIFKLTQKLNKKLDPYRNKGYKITLIETDNPLLLSFFEQLKEKQNLKFKTKLSYHGKP